MSTVHLVVGILIPSISVDVTAEDDEKSTNMTSVVGRVLPSSTLKLTGHSGSVYSLSYDPSGETLCSSSFDKLCFLWHHPVVESIFNSNADTDHEWQQPYENFNVLTGHSNAVLDCDWCNERMLVTCSADKTAALWDILAGTRVRKFTDATSVINAISVMGHGRSDNSTSDTNNVVPVNIFVTVCDDGYVRMYDIRQKQPTSIFVANPKPTTDDNGYPILAVAATAGNFGSNTQPFIFTGGLDNCVTAWDVRTMSTMRYSSSSSSKISFPEPLYTLGNGFHSDTITSLALDPMHTQLLSNCMDQTLAIWNIKPYVAGEERSLTNDNLHQRASYHRHTRSLVGHTHYGSSTRSAVVKAIGTTSSGALLKCAWSSDASLVTCGSTDALVHIWDTYTGKELYTLPGHSGSINAVAFHPHHANIVASGASDKLIFVGELE
jgi:Prp8 binding protein